MKKLLALCLLLFPAFGFAQQAINCAPSTPCNQSSGPSGTNTGDQAWQAFGKINSNFDLLPSEFFSSLPLTTSHGGTGATSLAGAGIPTFTGTITAGHCAEWASSTTLEDSGSGCGSSGGGVSSFTGDGTFLTNSASTGAVTATLGNTGVGYGVWGNTGSSSGAPGYHALSSYPTAAFPTLNQNTTGTAANITGTSNSTLTTLSALSLPSTQVTGLGTFATQNYATPPAIGGTTPAAGAFTTLSATSGSGTFSSTSSGVTLGSPTGGAQGAGTLNATGLYVNGVAVGTGGGNVSSSGTPTSGQFAEWTNSTTIAGETLGGDCTLSTATITCTKTNGTAFGTFATANAASPPAIGGTTPAAGAFTTLSASSTVSGTGFSTYLAAPPAIGGTTPAAGAFTTLSASSTVSGSGFSTYLASPPAIGGTAAAAGSFTTLSTNGGLTNSKAGAASTSAETFTGAPYAAGTGTTNFPLVYLNDGTGPSTFSTAGTEFGINAPSGFAGNFVDFHVNGGASVASITYQGVFTGSGAGLTSIPAANLTGTASVNTTGTASNVSGTPALPNGTTATTQTTGDNSTKLATDAFVIANAASAGVSSAAAGGGIAITGTGSGPYTGAITISTNAPSRTVTSSPTVASTDMGGTIYMNVSGGGTLTIPAISGSVFPAGSTLQVTNYSASTAAVSTTPTVNSGGGCVSGTGIPTGDTWQLQSNGTTLDCVQTVPSSSGGGVSSFTGDGTLITNSASTGGVTATLGNTGVGYGVWGNTGSSSGTPGYNALSSYPTAAFPTLNQNTTGTAANVTATSNSTLATLSALSLPSTQVTGLGTFATQNYATPPAIGGTTPAAGAFTTLSASSTVSGSGFSTYLASPPAIGGTTAAAGTFSSLTDSGVTGSTQCLHVNSSGLVSGTGSDCGSGGGSGTVNSGTAGQVAYYASTGTAVSGESNFTISAGALGLGASGTLGSVQMGNATSGTVTLEPVTGALGTVTASLPANTGTIDELNLAATFTGAKTFTNADLLLAGSTSGAMTLEAPAVASTYIQTFPAVTGTVADIGFAQTWTAAQTFTNSDIKLLGSSTGATTLTSANASATNYTLTVPAVTDTLATIGTAQTWTGAQTFTNADLLLKGSTSGAMTLEAPAVASTYIQTFPAATGTVADIGFAQTWTAAQTFTNSDLLLLGSSTGATTFTSANASATAYTVTVPANTGTLGELNLAQTWSALQTFGTNISIGGVTASGATGTGNVVFATSPSLTTPNLGTPSAATLTNATGLPVGGIAAMAADTIAANATGSSASPTAVAIGSLNMAILQATTTFTVAGTGCTPSAHSGTAFAGSVTLAATCTALTITMNGATGFTTTNGYHCSVGDKTTQAAGTWIPSWGESASTTTTATIPIPSAAGTTDVITFACTPY